MTKHKRIRRLSRPTVSDIEDFKAFLGPLANDYTTTELRQLRGEMHALADILLHSYLAKSGPELPSIEF